MRSLVLLAFFITTAVAAASCATSTTNAVVSQVLAQVQVFLSK